MSLNIRPIPTASGSRLAQVASDIWTIEGEGCVCYRPPIQPSYPYTFRTVVVRLDDGSLFVVSPVQITPEIQADVDQLGVVRHLVSPNNIHHLYLGNWHQIYPDARVYASPRLVDKRKDLNFYKVLSTDTPEPEWAGQIEQCLFGSGSGFIDELVFFHRKSRTVIFTDLIMDFDPEVLSPFSRTTAHWNQMYKHTPRGVQLAHMFDRPYLWKALETVRGWQAEHAIIAHSPWLCVDGQEEVSDLLESAFDWLQPRSALTENIAGISKLSILLAILPIHAFLVLTADIIYPKLGGKRDCIYPS